MKQSKLHLSLKESNSRFLELASKDGQKKKPTENYFDVALEFFLKHIFFMIKVYLHWKKITSQKSKPESFYQQRKIVCVHSSAFS